MVLVHTVDLGYVDECPDPGGRGVDGLEGGVHDVDVIACTGDRNCLHVTEETSQDRNIEDLVPHDKAHWPPDGGRQDDRVQVADVIADNHRRSLPRHVFDSARAQPVEHVDQGLEILTGVPAGELQTDGEFPDGSVHYLAQRRLLEMAASHAADEQLFFLASGGGSALASAPMDGIGFTDKRDAANHLMHAGASIGEINCVRKHLSALKGGRLARAAHPAPVTTLAISDVPGDDVADIASGPTIPDPSTQRDAIGILRAYRYPNLDRLLPILENPACESPKPGDPAFAGDRVELIGSAASAFAAAARYLEEEGYEVLDLGHDLDREARDLGREHAALAAGRMRAGRRVAILSGGETRVIVGENRGRGGRNLVYLSSLALELNGTEGVFALAADTDGIDGHGDHAGGVVLPGILELGLARGVALDTLLAADDSYTFFDACDLLIRTGPTRTNVNDFRVILCHP